jgi:plasmid stabilization system protein ParE
MQRLFLRISGVKKKYEVKITASARNDFQVLWDYIAQDSPGNAARFIDAVQEKVLSLRTFPERHPVIPESECFHVEAYRHLMYKDYRIVYRIQGTIVFVLRIFHGSKLLDLFTLVQE